MKLLRCAALALLVGCSHAVRTGAEPTAPRALQSVASTSAPTKATAAHPLETLSLERFEPTPERTPSVLSRAPEPGWIDLLPRLPASSTHPLGTALLVTLAQPAPGALPRVVLTEWDPQAGRALRSLRLAGDTLEVRSVMASGELLLVRLRANEDVELLRVDAALEHARVTPLDLGPHPSGLALVADAGHLVVSAHGLDGNAAVTRLLAVSREGRPLAHHDVRGTWPILGVLRHDPIVLRDGTVYVVGHDPAAPPGEATAEHPPLPGALGVLSFDADTLEPRAMRMTDVDESAPANLYASAKGVLLVSADHVFELDLALRAVKQSPRLHGPYLALGADGVVVDAPQRLRRNALAATQERACIPARLATLTLYACVVRDELGQGTLTMQR